jgi:hypothetical protein
MAETVKVRIAVAVSPTGRWAACGWYVPTPTHDTDRQMRVLASDGLEDPEEQFCWVEAEVPLPSYATYPGTPVAQEPHTKGCPLYRWSYEVGSGEPIPSCACTPTEGNDG